MMWEIQTSTYVHVHVVHEGFVKSARLEFQGGQESVMASIGPGLGACAHFKSFHRLFDFLMERPFASNNSALQAQRYMPFV